MNPRAAANAKGCIETVISLTKTKLLPHVPEIIIRLIHSVENRKLPMALPQIDFDCSRLTQYGESGRTIKYHRWHYQLCSGTVAGFRESRARRSPEEAVRTGPAAGERAGSNSRSRSRVTVVPEAGQGVGSAANSIATLARAAGSRQCSGDRANDLVRHPISPHLTGWAGKRIG
jgi:hypothetical protein